MREAPPPFRKPTGAPQSEAKPTEVVPPSPPPVVEPPTVIEPTTIIEPVSGWTPPVWLRSRRVQIALAAVGAIFLIGIVAAIAVDDEAPGAEPPRAPVASAAPTPKTVDPPAHDPAEPPPQPPEPAPEVEVEPVPEDAPAKRRPRDRPAKRTSSKPPPVQKKPASTRQVRLTVKSDPAGASIKVNGDSVDRGTAMVAANSTAKVTVTMRGYKRASRSVQVGKGKSIVIKLERM